ncbi:hypothetical protein AB72_2951 [Escherichia coli 1-250-04_S1_C3]|nr:hypothetical protein AB72_2951 [Escherichia coli 1-250-04_S1_C3]KDX29166.1 hypothetical protein AB41_2722 [Escherichia coli 1-250-04_S1_C2]KDX31016.1 hypothetical protein AB13_2459 [Escherichia coli 1-250-04_S1_C1]
MASQDLNNTVGLSPLTRGTPIWQSGRLSLDRFIPADAGNTSRYWRPVEALAVYPR